MTEIVGPVPTAAPIVESRRARLWRWAKRFQEFIGWLPISIALYVVAWSALGDRVAEDTSGTVVGILNLIQLIAHGIAAQGLAALIIRRYRRRLSDEDQERLWDALLEGKRGAILIYCMDFSVWLISIGASLAFFWLRR